MTQLSIVILLKYSTCTNKHRESEDQVENPVSCNGMAVNAWCCCSLLKQDELSSQIVVNVVQMILRAPIRLKRKVLAPIASFVDATTQQSWTWFTCKCQVYISPQRCFTHATYTQVTHNTVQTDQIDILSSQPPCPSHYPDQPDNRIEPLHRVD